MSGPLNRTQLDKLPLFDTPFLLGRSKSRDYRARTLLCAQATAEVLTELGISRINLAERFVAQPEQFKVLIGDLSDEGLEFARVHYSRWLANSDRWKGEMTLDKLKKSLAQQWEKFKKDGGPG